ncbi:hypothetical protein [Entomospira culicis]|uniref:Glycerol-3-phosphate acyltransferase n=1 Tax=Entomospira culicis TaxID=2719989 RepID=A0A968KW38_9SPIO|nr:hypothetical protein [Entomospira culicis]NIZ18551.1 hypothetical protein [Entomospira culicis]NIZ68767.1 hypothetical protein [Entomospira culicis]WDI37363.1 hypothetical protein PVA46_00830 [Entomospira culicis]WDI38992.1 hypothetical protein PVA47_00840 [Entomospira culicis]
MKEQEEQLASVENKLYGFFRATSVEQTEKLLSLLPEDVTEVVTPETVYRAGNPEARETADLLARGLILPGSKIIDAHHLAESWKLAQSGKSVLVLSEHFSNFDLTNITYLADNDPAIGKGFADNLIAMAGVKLSRDSDRFIAAFIQVYNRIVIMPSRSLDKLSGEELNEYKKMNLSAIKEMTKRKNSGHPILVFPTGTRTRPNQPDTAKAIPEMYSYMRGFDYIQFLSLNGLVLKVSDISMSADEPQPNVVMMGAAKPISSQEFMENAEKNCPQGMEMRDFVPIYLMQQLHSLHDYVEPMRLAVDGAF